MTKCARCLENKGSSEFVGGAPKASGQPYWCRACVRESQRQWRAKKPVGYFRKSQADRLTQPNYRLNAILHSAKKRAVARKLDFDLTKEWVEDRLRAGCCEVTGLPFDFTVVAKEAGQRRSCPVYRPTVDRVDSSKGYTMNNCQMVIWAYNVAKFDFGHDALVEWMTAWARTRPRLEGVFNQQSKVMGDDGSR